jgi:hypothetical protein
MGPFGGRPAVEEPDHRHRRLLRPRRERPRGRAAEQRDELAPVVGYRIGADQSGGNGTILQLVSRCAVRCLSRLRLR